MPFCNKLLMHRNILFVMLLFGVYKSTQISSEGWDNVTKAVWYRTNIFPPYEDTKLDLTIINL